WSGNLCQWKKQAISGLIQEAILDAKARGIKVLIFSTRVAWVGMKATTGFGMGCSRCIWHGLALGDGFIVGRGGYLLLLGVGVIVALLVWWKLAWVEDGIIAGGMSCSNSWLGLKWVITAAVIVVC
ncbi:hypothetical protein U1Q18_025456, partial [Sarracenia purpurea var. burkii]